MSAGVSYWISKKEMRFVVSNKSRLDREENCSHGWLMIIESSTGTKQQS